MQRGLLRAFVALWACVASVLVAAEAIVIGQTLPLGAADDGNSRRIVEGARAGIEAANAFGGVNGRFGIRAQRGPRQVVACTALQGFRG